MTRRPDPLRIAALSTAIAIHVAILLALLLPARPLMRGDTGVESALLVDIVRTPEPEPAPVPPPPDTPVRRVAPASPLPPAAASAERPGADPAVPSWRFDPEAGVTLVVYGSRPSLDLVAPDQPPAEMPHYRDAFNPADIDGLNGADAGGAVTFDVLVDEDGMPSAIVPTMQSGSQRAFETAMAVVGQWRFVPATKGGIPVPGWLEVSIEF